MTGDGRWLALGLMSGTTTSNPAASQASIASRVRRATPPRVPPVGDGRMNARGCADSAGMRVLSPRIPWFIRRFLVHVLPPGFHRIRLRPVRQCRTYRPSRHVRSMMRTAACRPKMLNAMYSYAYDDSLMNSWNALYSCSCQPS